MQRVTDVPGAPAGTLYIAEPESLSVRKTVPAANVLPELVVVLEKAENVPTPTTPPTSATRAIVIRIFRRSCTAISPWSVPWASAAVAPDRVFNLGPDRGSGVPRRGIAAHSIGCLSEDIE